MFRTMPLSIIRSLFTVHSAMVYVIQVCRELSSRTRMEMQFHPGPARRLSTNLYDKPLLSVQWINSWWWTEALSETCRVSCQNKFWKLMHLVGVYYKEICYDARSHERKKPTLRSDFISLFPLDLSHLHSFLPCFLLHSICIPSVYHFSRFYWPSNRWHTPKSLFLYNAGSFYPFTGHEGP